MRLTGQIPKVVVLATTILLAFVVLARSETANPKIRTVGFLYANHQFTTVIIQGFSNAFLTGINDSGEIAGGVDAGCFLRHANGSVSLISVPEATKCVARHVNNAGSVVGWYVSPSGSAGFLARGGGNITQINIPNCISTSVESINNKSEMVGSCARAGTDISEGFLLQASGTITMINPAIGNCNISNGRKRQRPDRWKFLYRST